MENTTFSKFTESPTTPPHGHRSFAGPPWQRRELVGSVVRPRSSPALLPGQGVCDPKLEKHVSSPACRRTTVEEPQDSPRTPGSSQARQGVSHDLRSSPVLLPWSLVAVACLLRDWWPSDGERSEPPRGVDFGKTSRKLDRLKRARVRRTRVSNTKLSAWFRVFFFFSGRVLARFWIELSFRKDKTPS